MKTKIPKIISGIFATLSLMAIAFVLLPSFWFWVLFEFSAAMLVAYGCIGEWYLHHHPAGRKKVEKEEHHKQESRYIISVALGVTMDLFVLAHSIREGVKLENKVSEANERTTNAESNIVALNKATIELVHQYDLSTNALAEAKARLATIKPAKERLMDLLQDIARDKTEEMMQALRSNRPVTFGSVTLDAYQLHQLEDFLKNSETKSFISVKRGTGSHVEMMGTPVSEQVDLTIFPSLLK
jgi:hypothetical protein